MTTKTMRILSSCLFLNFVRPYMVSAQRMQQELCSLTFKALIEKAIHSLSLSFSFTFFPSLALCPLTLEPCATFQVVETLQRGSLESQLFQLHSNLSISKLSLDVWINILQMITPQPLYDCNPLKNSNQPKEPASWDQLTPRTMRANNKKIIDVVGPCIWGHVVTQWKTSGMIFLHF